MEDIIREILERLRAGEELDAKALLRILNDHNKRLHQAAKSQPAGSCNRDAARKCTQPQDSQSPRVASSHAPQPARLQDAPLAQPMRPARPYSKKKLLPFYLRTKERHPETWAVWNVTPELEQQLMALLQVKPRRSASGVATITVITKPWKCAGTCIYCPNDLRMPKSYLSDEPACQRAERNYFDPYLQVVSRLRALDQMGHATDKIELIVLGGSWSDYPRAYQLWFITELFRALNDAGTSASAAADPAGTSSALDAPFVPDAAPSTSIADGPSALDAAPSTSTAPDRPDTPSASYAPFVPDATPSTSTADSPSALHAPFASSSAPAAPDLARPERQSTAPLPFSSSLANVHARDRRAFYKRHGLSYEKDDLVAFTCDAQRLVDAGELTYNEAATQLYESGEPWSAIAREQHATLDQLISQQQRNEQAKHRVVGLVVETRPGAVTPETLTFLRQLGATKLQMGIQSLDQHIHELNRRPVSTGQIERALDLARLFGFKTHTHFMVNLLGSTPESDEADFARFVTETPYQPDEIKLYPCALIRGTTLCDHYAAGEWQPYDEATLVDVLVADVLATPAFTRISRMIRDFSAHDIMAGNKKVNLRQLVEARAELRAKEERATIQEIRHREISTSDVEVGELTLDIVPYETTSTRECFLQWVTPENKIAGFLRLSLPKPEAFETYAGDLPVLPDEAMIREVHVYGRAASLHQSGTSAQHRGLGKKLIERACAIAREAGYAKINVISAIGTREYYRALGFTDQALYLQRDLLA